jgi:hypothetical protein
MVSGFSVQVSASKVSLDAVQVSGVGFQKKKTFGI